MQSSLPQPRSMRRSECAPWPTNGSVFAVARPTSLSACWRSSCWRAGCTPCSRSRDDDAAPRRRTRRAADGVMKAARRNDFSSRGHAAYWAFVVHRVSGIALTLFLPLHFFALSQALARRAALDDFIAWTRHPAVRLAETLLVIALAAHLAGGVRLLLVEFVGWRR